MSSTSKTLQMWDKLTTLPLGTWLFSQAVCFKAPYFRTIRPRIVELRPGFCDVRAANRRRVRNHLGTFHAIASCNLAEVAAGMFTEVSIPTTHRWIPTGMTVEYLAKAGTHMRGVAKMDALPEVSDEPQEWVVPVDITDTAGTVAVTARITMRVTPKRKPSTAA